MAGDASGLNSLARAEHIDPQSTGDNIAAKKVANYVWDGANWQRQSGGLLTSAWDYVAMTNADVNGNYQTWTYKTGGSSGTTVMTLTYTYDGSSNVTSITRS